MKGAPMKAISLLAGAALLAFASAQAGAQSGQQPSTADNQFKCWDTAKNQIRDRLAGLSGQPSTIGSTTSNNPSGTSTTGRGFSGSSPSNTSQTPGAGGAEA